MIFGQIFAGLFPGTLKEDNNKIFHGYFETFRRFYNTFESNSTSVFGLDRFWHSRLSFAFGHHFELLGAECWYRRTCLMSKSDQVSIFSQSLLTSLFNIYCISLDFSIILPTYCYSLNDSIGFWDFYFPMFLCQFFFLINVYV